jgi:hypothetical protein
MRDTQSGFTRQSSSVKATMSLRLDSMPMLRARVTPRVSVRR